VPKNLSELHPGKIRWKCRRGMLELDMILLRFVDQKYCELSPSQQQQFSDLLNEPDPVLYNWFLGYDAPEDKELVSMVNLIQEYSRCD
jgi:antitoxin CptB